MTEIINSINWVDILGIIIAIIGIYLGTRNGLTSELFRFIGTVLSLVIAVHWYSQAAELVIMNFPLPAWLSQFLCFVLIVQGIRIIFKYGVVGLLKVMNLQFVPQLERIGGAIVGLGRGILFYGILILVLSFVPIDYFAESIYDKSYSGTFIVNAMEKTYRSLTFWMPEAELEKSIFSIPAPRLKVKEK